MPLTAEEIGELAAEVERSSVITLPMRERIAAALREFEADKRDTVLIPRLKI